MQPDHGRSWPRFPLKPPMRRMRRTESGLLSPATLFTRRFSWKFITMPRLSHGSAGSSSPPPSRCTISFSSRLVADNWRGGGGLGYDLLPQLGAVSWSAVRHASRDFHAATPPTAARAVPPPSRCGYSPQTRLPDWPPALLRMAQRCRVARLRACRLLRWRARHRPDGCSPR